MLKLVQTIDHRLKNKFKNNELLTNLPFAAEFSR